MAAVIRNRVWTVWITEWSLIKCWDQTDVLLTRSTWVIFCLTTSLLSNLSSVSSCGWSSTHPRGCWPSSMRICNKSRKSLWGSALATWLDLVTKSDCCEYASRRWTVQRGLCWFHWVRGVQFGSNQSDKFHKQTKSLTVFVVWHHKAAFPPKFNSNILLFQVAESSVLCYYFMISEDTTHWKFN